MDKWLHHSILWAVITHPCLYTYFLFTMTPGTGTRTPITEIPTLLSLVAPEVVIMTTSGATSDNKSWHYDSSRLSATYIEADGTKPLPETNAVVSPMRCSKSLFTTWLLEKGDDHFDLMLSNILFWRISKASTPKIHWLITPPEMWE